MVTVIVTGASKGIGAAICDILAGKGANVVATARSEEQLQFLRKTHGPERVAYVVGDICDEKVRSAIMSKAIESFGGVDAVIFNAGALDPVGSIADANCDQWKRLFDINFFSVLDLTAKCIPELRKSRGKLVYVSSGASIAKKPSNGLHWGAYGASKAALNHFVTTVADEEKNVSAISIAPGVVDTAMQKDIRETFGSQMGEMALSRFTELERTGGLLPPRVPAAVYANLALRGWPDVIDGMYLRYSDERLVSYLE